MKKTFRVESGFMFTTVFFYSPSYALALLVSRISREYPFKSYVSNENHNSLICDRRLNVKVVVSIHQAPVIPTVEMSVFIIPKCIKDFKATLACFAESCR